MRAANDPDYGQHNSRTTPEAMLVRAILARAVLDLFGPLVGYGDAHLIRRDAMVFLTCTGHDARDRDWLCSISGYDGDQLRRNVIEVLEGSDADIFTSSRKGGFGCLDDARALWAEQKRRAKRVVSACPDGTVTDTSVTALPPKPAPRLPRIIPKVDRAAVERAAVFALIKQPQKQKYLIDALADEMSYHRVLTILNDEIAAGSIIRDEARRYRAITSTCG